jgi:hypothetical protein
MRRILAVFALFLMIGSFAWANEPADVVVLLDTSESMFPYFEGVVDYIVSRVARDYLRQNDTFHLLTFSDSAQLEIAQSIQDEEDVRGLISRLYLVYPFGKHTDLITAINYLKQYTQDLPQRATKFVVIITDGIHNPSAASPYAGYDETRAMEALVGTAGEIAKNGWKISIIRIPFNPNDKTAAAEKGELDPDVLMKGLQDSLNVQPVDFDPSHPDSVAQSAMALPTLEFPGDLGKKGSDFSFPVSVKNTTADKLNLELKGAFSSGADMLQKHSFLKLPSGGKGSLSVSVRIPDSVKDGDLELPIRLEFADSVRVSPSSGTLKFTLRRSPASTFFRNAAPILLFALILAAAIALIIVIVIMLRHLPGKSNATVVEAVRASGAQAEKGTQAARFKPEEAKGEAVSAKAAQASAGAAAAAGPAAESAPFKESLQQKSVASAKNNNALALVESSDSLKKANRTVFEVDAKVSAASMGGYAIPVEEKQSEDKLRSERKAFDEAAEREGAKRAESLIAQLKVKKDASIMVQMTIDRQNPNIGLRNVHSIKSGNRLTVGGGKASAFTVFVVKVPRRLAEIYFDGENCVLVPIRKDYFPGLEGAMDDCLGKDIAIETPEGFKMTMRLARWESATDKMNRLLHIIDMRGLI